MDRNKILDMVVDMLEQAVGCDRQACKPEASLYADLGIESIDLLDIQFRIERMFNISMNRDELFADDVLHDRDKCIENGFVNDHGMALLKKAMPFVDWNRVATPLKASEIQNVYTVDTLVNFIDNKLKKAV